MMCRFGLIVFVMLGFAAPACAGQKAGSSDTTAPGRIGRSDDVPQEMRQAVMDRFARSFMLPDTVIWKFDFTQPYPIGGTAVCGRVNYQDSTRRYVGELPFFARLDNGRVVQSGIVSRIKIQDPVHANANAFAIACGSD